ncbi:MAG: polysaccharide deacetylase family protein [Cytophagaceae bacterium]|nr:polysaccharide deacetylase family protein [Cytophagaceae bacterium]
MEKSGSYIRNIFYALSKACPSSLIIPPRTKRIILPAYHLVSNNNPPHIKHLYSCRNEKEFIKDLDFLLKFYTPIDLHQLIKFTREEQRLEKNYFHLSFDDGLKESYEIIAPILRKKGIPASFFINPAFIDNKDLMFRYKASILIDETQKLENTKLQTDHIVVQIQGVNYSNRSKLDDLAELIDVDFQQYLVAHRPYLLTYEINELIKQGFTIGAHSIDHPLYNELTIEAQILQTQKSIALVTQKFNLDYKIFAFPFTDDGVSRALFETVFNSTPPLADLTFGVAGIKKDTHPNHLQRIPMEKKHKGEALIIGEYLYYLFKKPLGRNEIKRS